MTDGGSLIQWHAPSPAVRAKACLELVRPRIAVLVLITTMLGFFQAPQNQRGPARILLLIHTLAGTAMVAGGANALNQFLEADLDSRMTRTRRRPLPSGRLRRAEALCFGTVIGVGGIAYLSILVNGVAGALGGLTLATYVLLYTPMKRASWHSVFLGAVPGAMPPVIGWAASTGSVSVEALVLFTILFIWQLPHFAAIAWLHRADYGRAGFPMLSVIDATGRSTCRHMLLFSVLLTLVSLLPSLHGMAGSLYAVGAAALGLTFTGCGVIFARSLSAEAARFHLAASVVYLPALVGLMTLERSLLKAVQCLDYI